MHAACALPQPVRVAAVVYKFGAAVLFDVSADHSVEADPLLVLLREHKGKAAPDWRPAGAQAAASQPLYMEGGRKLLLVGCTCRALAEASAMTRVLWCASAPWQQAVSAAGVVLWRCPAPCS